MKKFARLGLAIATLALIAATGSAEVNKFDGSHIPIVVTPQYASISQGDSDAFTITMNGNVTSDTVINLSSSDPSLSVPATATVTSGHNSVLVYGDATINHRFHQGTTVTVTASANGGSASTTITVN
jgi:hypothetical protein